MRCWWLESAGLSSAAASRPTHSKTRGLASLAIACQAARRWTGRARAQSFPLCASVTSSRPFSKELNSPLGFPVSHEKKKKKSCCPFNLGFTANRCPHSLQTGIWNLFPSLLSSLSSSACDSMGCWEGHLQTTPSLVHAVPLSALSPTLPPVPFWGSAQSPSWN